MTWLSIVKEHHKGIKRAFVVAINDPSEDNIKNLDFLIMAHSIAEEAAIYPEVASHGMDDENLEAEQTEAKEQIHYLLHHYNEPSIVADLKKLMKAVLEHALVHEEKNKFKKLDKKLSTPEKVRIEKKYLEFYDKWSAR